MFGLIIYLYLSEDGSWKLNGWIFFSQLAHLYQIWLIDISLLHSPPCQEVALKNN